MISIFGMELADSLLSLAPQVGTFEGILRVCDGDLQDSSCWLHAQEKVRKCARIASGMMGLPDGAMSLLKL